MKPMHAQRVRVLLSLICLAVGLGLVLSSLSITGYAVAEKASAQARSIAGLALLLIGIWLAMARHDEGDEREWYREPKQHERGVFRARDAVRHENQEAHYWAKRAFRYEHGHLPSKHELQRYIRSEHEHGRIPELVESQRRQH